MDVYLIFLFYNIHIIFFPVFPQSYLKISCSNDGIQIHKNTT